MTGRPVTRTEWPSREPFGSYNYASRNQMCVAYLDGKTPSLVVERGTYNYITVAAYQYRKGRLRELWRWDNKHEPRRYWGQGAHIMHAADVNGDGRDEIILGSAVLASDGKALWSTGLGHPDSVYVGHIDPSLPGLQIYYNLETHNPRNGMRTVNARTGKILWGYDKPTVHIHSQGMCSPLDPKLPGCQCYGGERDFKEKLLAPRLQRQRAFDEGPGRPGHSHGVLGLEAVSADRSSFVDCLVSRPDAAAPAGRFFCGGGRHFGRLARGDYHHAARRDADLHHNNPRRGPPSMFDAGSALPHGRGDRRHGLLPGADDHLRPGDGEASRSWNWFPLTFAIGYHDAQSHDRTSRHARSAYRAAQRRDRPLAYRMPS